MPITTGQLFTCVLVGITPTALGRALAHAPANPVEWGAALAADTQGTPPLTNEDPNVVQEFQNFLSTYPAIYTALLQTVYQPDPIQAGDFQPTSLANVMMNALAMLGKQPGFLNTSQDWSNPPHPSGADVTSLIALLSPYDETPRTLSVN